VGTPAVLCFFSHHRPWLVKEDEGILSLARENGWEVSKVWEDKEAGVSSLRSYFFCWNDENQELMKYVEGDCSPLSRRMMEI